MNSRPTSKDKNRWLIAGAVFLLAVLSWRFFPAPGTFLSDTIIRPILQGESFLHNLATDPAAEPSTEELAELQVLRAESAAWRTLAEGDEEGNIPAGVIGRPTALPYDVLLLDRGSGDGVLPGAPVFAGKDTAIGFIAAVYEKSSLVALVSTPGYVSTVYVYGPNIYTTAVGLGGGVTRIHVPQGVPLSIGDTVVMPSLARGIYGSVTAVDSVPERPEQYGYLTGEIPISSLRLVFIGRRPLTKIDFDEARETVDTTRRDFLTVDVPEDILIDVDSELATESEEMTTSAEGNAESEPVEDSEE